MAVVGAGVSGLAAAHELATSCAGGVDVTVYEKEDSLGGSFARTVGVDGGAGGEVVHLHLGFMPFNSVGAHMNIYMLVLYIVYFVHPCMRLIRIRTCAFATKEDALLQNIYESFVGAGFTN